MRTGRGAGALAVGLVLIFLLSLVPATHHEGSPTLDAPSVVESTPLGQLQTLTIGSWPDGANQRVEVSVPDGHAIKSLDVDLEAGTLNNPMGSVLTDAGDFDQNAVYDGMDVNKSSLQILPQDWSYDFESGSFGPEWTRSGSSNWAIVSDTRLGGAKLAKAGTISHNQESRLTLDVSQLPASTGTFRYSVSSEGSFDYLLFCIDNTGCSRYSGYNYRWSGTVNNGNQAFTIPATAQTLTWKYVKDGSVNSGSDTAWADDIVITPSGGPGNGEGNWTSDVFGPSLLGRGEHLSHGLLHMDARIYPGSVFEWQVLDASTSSPVPGFERLTSTWADLGMIDAQAYPLLRFKVHMKEAPDGETSEIRSWSLNGHLHKSFDSDPTDEGWTLQGGSWSNGAITSSTSVLSDTYHVRSGFSAIDTNSTHTGAGVLQYSLDGGQSWQSIDAVGREQLQQPAYMVQFRMVNATGGGTFTWSDFQAELIRTSIPDGVRLDVGLDGANEWSLDGAGHGVFGLQNTWVTDDMWATYAIEPANAASLEVAVPNRGVHAFSFAVASPSGTLASPFLAMAVNGQDILSRNLDNINDLSIVTLTASELTTLNNALSQASGQHGPAGLPMATVEVRIGSSLSSEDLLVGGVFAPYDADVSMALNAGHPLVLGLNHALSSTIPALGQRTVTLPLRLDGTGSVAMGVMDMESQPSVKALELTVHNVTDTLVPGLDWVESVASFDFTPLGITDALTHAKQSSWLVELHLSGAQQQSKLQCPIASLPITSTSLAACTATGTALIWFDEGTSGSISAVGSGQFLEVMHHFRFPDGWDDEAAATMSVSLISSSGPLLPVSKVFGLGLDNGVENDVEIKSWSVLSNNGIRSSAAYPYLRAGEVVHMEVQLGFENTTEGMPRSGQTLVRFLVDGNEYATTTLLQDGVALFPYTVPMGRSSMTLGVEVVPLRGQSVVSSLPDTLTFLFDNVPPTLMSSSVEAFDSRDVAPRTPLSFTVADRPHLPTHANLHLWQSWLNDGNQNGVMDADEVVVRPLTLPENLTLLMGEYSATIDTSKASQADYFLGWLEIADSAGHIMADGGSISQPMFNVQLNSNGAPSLGATSLGWNDGQVSPWLHPQETYELRVPVWEQNGINDLSEIVLELAANTAQPAAIHWNQTTGVCESMNVYVEVESCDLVPADAEDLFSRNGEFVVHFTVEWGYDPDLSVVRVPQISLLDQSGQSNRFMLEPLSWRFSGELAIDPDSIRIALPNEANDSLGYWVQPRTTFDVMGDLVWYRTGTSPSQPLDVELTLGENNLEADVINGTFQGSMLAPLVDGTYGLYGDLRDAPNGAVYRGDDAAFVWFIVDNQAPRVAAVDRPGFNTMLAEEDWKDLQFELRLDENAQLDESSLRLHWSLNEAGLGLNSYVFDNGSLPLEILGERRNGESIPVRCTLDVDALMIPAFRTKAVELRVWVTGDDEAGLSIDAVYNDINAPLRVWNLEQRVPVYSISNIEMKPNSDIHQGDLIEVSALITNSGLADGEANLVLEQVESSGARTRLEARVVDVQAGEQMIYQFLWKPGRDGSQWLELSIVNGPNAQSPTVLVDEPRSDGVFGTISTVNPVLLVVVFLLTVGLVALLVFGLRREEIPAAPLRPNATKQAPAIPDNTAASGPYGAAQEARSPGENPYQ